MKYDMRPNRGRVFGAESELCSRIASERPWSLLVGVARVSQDHCLRTSSAIEAPAVLGNVANSLRAHATEVSKVHITHR